MPKDYVGSMIDNGTSSLCSCEYYSVNPLASIFSSSTPAGNRAYTVQGEGAGSGWV